MRQYHIRTIINLGDENAEERWIRMRSVQPNGLAFG